MSELVVEIFYITATSKDQIKLAIFLTKKHCHFA